MATLLRKIQGYMQAEFGHLKFYRAKPEMELQQGFCDFCLFPERVYYGDTKLHQYASDPFVPDLAKDTELHLILFQFKGFDLYRLEEIPQSP